MADPIIELKARAYDIISTIEGLQGALQQTNQEIAKLVQAQQSVVGSDETETSA